MPCIKVKVCQDLYRELGLCPTMELVRSDSGGSIKFVPVSDERGFDDSERSLEANPECENSVSEFRNSGFSVKVGSKNAAGCAADKLPENRSPNAPPEGINASESTSSGEPSRHLNPSLEDAAQLRVDSTPEPDSSMEMTIAKMEVVDAIDTSARQANQTVNVLSSIALPSLFHRFTTKPPTKFTSSSFLNDVCCIELDSRGHLSSVSLTAPPKLANTTTLSTSVNASSPSPLSTDENPSHKVCSKGYPDPDTESFSSPCDKRITYPRTCENCLSVYKHGSSFARHKKSCGEVRQRRLKVSEAAGDPEPSKPKNKNVGTLLPRACEKCGVVFEESRAFKYHLKKCDKYRRTQTMSTSSERTIAIPPGGTLGSNNDLKYIPINQGSESLCRFFIRKKTAQS